MTVPTYEEAKRCGAIKIDPGINWVWAIGFPSYAHAESFIEYLDANCIEHRGIYIRQDSPVCDVRFR